MPMELLGCCAEIDEVAQHRGVLKEGTEQLGAVDLLKIAYNQLKAKTRCAGFKDVDGLGEARGIHVEFVGPRFLLTRLARAMPSAAAVASSSRGVCQLHAGEIQDHLLVVQQTFKSALGYLWLVGCVGGIPTRILQQFLRMTLGVSVSYSPADEGAAVAVFAGKLFGAASALSSFIAAARLSGCPSAMAAGTVFSTSLSRESRPNS